MSKFDGSEAGISECIGKKAKVIHGDLVERYAEKKISSTKFPNMFSDLEIRLLTDSKGFIQNAFCQKLNNEQSGKILFELRGG